MVTAMMTSCCIAASCLLSAIFTSNNITTQYTTMQYNKYSTIVMHKIKPCVHELNNEGCRCQLCQKLIHIQNSQIVIEPYLDRHSQQYASNHEQTYLKLIEELATFEQFPRKIRFLLPEICVYEKNHPFLLISKGRDNAAIRSTHDKTKMHFFELQNFFLDGYNSHLHRRNRIRSSQLFKSQCIILAKYRNNRYNMLTLGQVQGLYKSKNRHMLNGLLYLQTVIGNQQQHIIRVKMEDMFTTPLCRRAQTECKIIFQQIKTTDDEYYPDKQEIDFENQLRKTDISTYLLYLSFKMVFLSAKRNVMSINAAVFKYATIGTQCYLIDVRTKSRKPSSQFWASSVMQAFEYKLKKTMSMMELEPQKININPEKVSFRAKEVSSWLQHDTEHDMMEMGIIRNRLQKLEEEKKSLAEIQARRDTTKMYKLRKSVHVKKSDIKW